MDIQDFINSRKSNRWFKTNNIQFSHQPIAQIDEEAGIIRNVVMCQVGEASGHGIHLEQDFINNVVELANQSEVGIKSRFGHPTMSNEALGTYTGRFKDARVDGNRAIADVHLSDAAEVSPNGNLKDYIIRLAKEDPESFGCSIVFTPGGAYQYNNDGERVDILDDGSNFNPQEKLFETISVLHGCDFVDDGAATDALFSSETFNEDSFAVVATKFMDENPKIIEFLAGNPDKFNSFLEKYNLYFNKKNDTKMKFSEKFPTISKWFNLGNDEIVEESVTTEEQTALSTMEEKFAEQTETINELTAKNAELEEKVAAFENGTQEDSQLIDELRGNVESLTAGVDKLKEEYDALENENKELKEANIKLSNDIPGAVTVEDDGNVGEVEKLAAKTPEEKAAAAFAKAKEYNQELKESKLLK